jgi:DNA mismatch repair protein MutH
MKLLEAKLRLERVVNRPFREILSESNSDLIIDKGRAGKALEIVLGLQNSPNPKDFEDGELKTNKCDRYGNPLETVFICQIMSMIDDLIMQRPFEESHLCEKISNMLYVPVCKEGAPGDWYFLPCIHVDLKDQKFSSLLNIWREDYYSICSQLRHHIENGRDGFIHTSNGRHIQVRSKDSKPYHPIYSRFYNKNVSDKNHAFYFQKEFVFEIKRRFSLD